MIDKFIIRGFMMKDNSIQNTFLIEEYKANWEYIRHIELIRLKLFQLYLIITTSLFTIIIALYKFYPHDKNNINFFQEYKWILFSLFLFHSIYGWLYIWFTWKQKQSQERYRDYNSNIKHLIYTNITPKLLQNINSTKSHSFKFNSAYFAWISLPISIASISTALCLYFLFFNLQ